MVPEERADICRKESMFYILSLFKDALSTEEFI
jgi:hypothetical protein